MGWKQALYKLQNPNKYIGDSRKLIYKSSWEEEAFKVCDNNPNVLEWGYEIAAIPYMAPGKGGPHTQQIKKYIPDLYIVSQNGDGEVTRWMIEIKPHKQTKPGRSKNPKNRLVEDYTYVVNRLKWEAAQNWCDQRGIKFKVVTERELFAKR